MRTTFVFVAAALLACGACGGDSSSDQGGGSDGGPGSVQDGSTGTSDGGSSADANDGAVTTPDGGGSACPGAKPDATNTGVPAGTTLTTVNDDVTVTADNTVIDGEDINGFLIIQASHVTVKRSIVRGKATTQTTGIIKIQSGTDTTIEDVEIAAAAPSVDLDGLQGASFVARRLNIHGGVDGMKVDHDSTVECSYIHDLVSFDSDPNQAGGPTHNDDIQILSGTHIHIVGNNLVAATDQNSAIQVTQDFGAVSDLHVEHNWADGGGCTFNFSHKGTGQTSLTDVHTLGNRFGRNSFFTCPILRSNETTLDASGDVYDDDNTAVPIQHHD